ncbi:MAG: TetR/AcrR family transcriptional regulator C-terminal domain-containing protein [Gordonia sp. (in: high G+C Gram-positive bacteria)]
MTRVTRWDHEHPPRRGRAPDLAGIVRAAVALADAGGIEAVSLRRVASVLGSGTATFYRVLNNRDELLDHMVDAVLGRHLPPVPSGEWRADLAAVARNRRTMLTAHSWLGVHLAARPAIGPNALTHHDRALAAAATYADDPTATSSAVETIFAYVLGATAREQAEKQVRLRSGLTDGQWHASVAPYLQQALDTGAYPHLKQMVETAVDLDADTRFERGLSCVLDGLAAQRPDRRKVAGQQTSTGR